MFRGINSVSLDTKGRFAMPVRFRDAFLGHLVATIDTGATCLLLYPVTNWGIIEQKLQALPSFNKAARRIQRLLIGHATDLELDESGRVLLPKILREYAKIEKQAVLVGQGSKLELWDEQLWQTSCQTWIDEAGEDGEGGSNALPEEWQTISL